MGRERYSAKDVSAALVEARGVKAAAARHLGCSRNTIERYITLYPTVREAYELARAELIDLAESKLVEQLEAGEWPAVKYTLSTLGKARGYVERIERDDTAAHEVLVSRRIDGLTDSELVEFVIEALYARSKQGE